MELAAGRTDRRGRHIHRVTSGTLNVDAVADGMLRSDGANVYGHSLDDSGFAIADDAVAGSFGGWPGADPGEIGAGVWEGALQFEVHLDGLLFRGGRLFLCGIASGPRNGPSAAAPSRDMFRLPLTAGIGPDRRRIAREKRRNGPDLSLLLSDRRCESDSGYCLRV